MSYPDFHIDRRAFAGVRRTAAYRAVVDAWSEPALVACSGGADSMALLATASVALQAGRIHPFCVVHVDHRTRPETVKEGRFVASAAREFGRPFVQIRLQPRPPGCNDAQGPEARLRADRYQALSELASRMAISPVVTAHTKDDQIETILLRLLSGASSLAGTGMREIREIGTGAGRLEIRRPLLEVSRAELHRVLSILNLPHREDPSNDDLALRRNRLRHRVIPELAQIDPGFGDGLIRAVNHAAGDAIIVERLAREAYDQHVHREGHATTIRRAFLRNAEIALSSRVVRDAIRSFVPEDNRELTRERIVAVVNAAAGRTGATVEIPYGVVATVTRDQVVICRVGQVGTDNG